MRPQLQGIPFSASVSTGIYVHWPFCRVRCSYCPFAITTDQSLESSYIDALLIEIEKRGSAEQLVHTIFFGGGTPSRSSVEHLARVRSQIEASYAYAPVEFSIEANPEDVTAGLVSEWSALGIDRISLGIQSLHDEELRPLGRVHGRDLALRAIEHAAGATAPTRVSADLILGLPGQTVESYLESLELTLSSGIGHLSVYMLDLEEGTALHRQVELGRVRLPEDSLVADLYHRTIEVTSRYGLEQYEVSNFARPGEECLHNLRYWRRERYDGFGSGAHSFDGSGLRFGNSRDVQDYIEKITTGASAVELSDPVGSAESQREEIFLALRQVRGIEYSRLLDLRGEDAEKWIDDGKRNGWLSHTNERIRLTADGFLVSNELLSALF